MNKKIALIPAYKPDEKLTEIVKELVEHSFEIVIVDDGSGEKYREIFENAQNNAKVISYEKNKGKGGALKEGLKYIKASYDSNTTIVTMDCDGQHLVIDAEKLCAKVDKELKLVIGKRTRNKKIPLRSKIGKSITRIVFFLVTKVKLYDTQVGLRAFNYNLLDLLLSVPGNKYEYEINVLLQCTTQNIKIEEVEIQTIYINSNENSHFSTIRDSFSIYKEIVKFILSTKKKK